MKQKILIIEDDNSEYVKIKENIDSSKYDIIPNTIEDFQVFNDLISSDTSDSIAKYKDLIRSVFEKDYKTLRLVICDIRFKDGKTSIQGYDVISFIRNYIEIEQLNLFTKLIPIIAYTNHSNAEEGEKALLAGADINIQKNGNPHFSKVVDNLCRRFSDSYVNNQISHIETYLETYKDLLVENNRLITHSFDNIEFLIKGNHEEILKNFGTLFNAVFVNMDSAKQKKFFEDFENEITGFLTYEQKKKLKTNFWQEVSLAVSELNSKGSLKQFVDTIYELMDNAGILGTKGKIIGAAIKGGFGLISKI
ncbi:MAG: hypothetical protein CVU11_00010 [Bacteroidetes bacterium HGW-Bacteroidetes-6]|jgi:CheY-like chemotaxis protein|nr:MAG: hypothetical protein CVU11_00010 [Bacteroidetes bacterium HGW-Bacteroidetes-6]